SASTNYRPDLGRQDLNWISPDQIERIEVVRGPMSSLYGSDAMGGVINIITRRIGDDWSGSATHSYTRPGDGKRGDTQQIGAT
ncbi:TonB-dependent receptor plug domain-containing protein, partial [Acinetobacter baumannii]